MSLQERTDSNTFQACQVDNVNASVVHLMMPSKKPCKGVVDGLESLQVSAAGPCHKDRLITAALLHVALG